MRGAVTRGALEALAALVVTASATGARADPAARLDYTRAPGAEVCADEATLRSEVARRVGSDPFGPAAKETVVAHIEPLSSTRTGFVAHIAVLDEGGTPHGRRELRTHGSCDELVDAVALAIAIAIGPPRLVRATPDVPPSPVASAAAPPKAPVPVVPPDDVEDVEDVRDSTLAAPESRPLALEVSLGGVASMGTAPAPSVGADVGVALRWPTVSLGAEARVDAPASATAQGGGSVSASRIVATVVPCWEPRPWFVCGEAQAGRIVAIGETPQGTHSVGPWWAAGARFGARIPITARIAFRLRSELVADLDPPHLVLNGQSAWRAPAVAASLGADVVVRFP